MAHSHTTPFTSTSASPELESRRSVIHEDPLTPAIGSAVNTGMRIRCAGAVSALEAVVTRANARTTAGREGMAMATSSGKRRQSLRQLRIARGGSRTKDQHGGAVRRVD